MTEQERKVLLILEDRIKGEINRMCVTNELPELRTMAMYATRNIDKLHAMRYTELMWEQISKGANNGRKEN